MLKALVALNENLKSQEAQFRASCKKQRAQLLEKTEALKQDTPDEELLARRELIQDTLVKDTEKLTKIRQLLAKKNRVCSFPSFPWKFPSHSHIFFFSFRILLC
jgi:hypothetical protein